MTISEKPLDQLSQFVARRMGLHFPKERRADLERGVMAAAREFGIEKPESFIEMLLTSPVSQEQVETLAGCLTIGETYFFRDTVSFKIFKGNVLPELIRRHRDDRQIRIWSAGCATGEEPYSMAMLLAAMIPDIRDWKITILGTDINPRFLRKAGRGIYGAWSFRDTPAWVKARYFTKRQDGHFVIHPHLKEMVTFSCLNLAEDTYPSLLNNTNAMDMILCRNVLMYFTPDMEAKVIASLSRCLVEGGWLVVSPCEASKALLKDFSQGDFSGAPFYRRRSCPEKEGSRAFSTARALGEPERDFRQGFHRPESFSVPAPFPEPPPARAAEAEAFPKGVDACAEAHLLYDQGCYTEAKAKLVALLEFSPLSPRAMALLARVHANEGCLSQALEWSEKAIAADKINPGYRHLLAMILEEEGRMEDAVTTLKGVIYLDPDFTIAHFSLANLLRRLGRIEEAGKYFENALALLGRAKKDEIIAGSDGLTAGRMIEIIESTSPRR